MGGCAMSQINKMLDGIGKQKRIPARTVCINCRHFLNNGPVWYSQFCGHPKHAERVMVQDPVTGEYDYGGTNDLGGSYIDNNKHPHARDINKGDCELYEVKP